MMSRREFVYRVARFSTVNLVSEVQPKQDSVEPWRGEAVNQMTPLATAGTAEYRTRNVEGRRRKPPREGTRRHEKSGSTDFDLASLPSPNLLNFRVFRGYLIRQLVPFFLRHSLFDIHLFASRWWLNSCQKNKLSHICRTVKTLKTWRKSHFVRGERGISGNS
jgi:hypothetical protein